jgi:AmmeMemoRadiSam system radical SAM enzyme/AmmeMemoRadiSam system protein B/AmmeMemoRadiSam system protein A
MNRVIHSPPPSSPRSDGSVDGGWWHDAADDRIVCDLCPRQCHLKPGDRGFCFVRENRDGRMVLSTYGRSTGFCIDPIEKKPLNHFYPGTSVLSFGTAGCNLGCKFCQNWSISKSREVRQLSELATPDAIAAAAEELRCHSVAFTYNDPVIWAEYAIDTARACRQRGIKTVAVTAGYITPAARPTFFELIDAANVDLKAFTEGFYQHLTLSHLQPVLDTLVWLRHESNVWLEITNLVIPQENDSDDEFRRMCDWILQHLGDEVPVHFTAFHPDFRLRDRERTPLETLLRGYDIARAAGIKYAYVGNVDDTTHQSTYCPACQALVIERNWYELGQYNLTGNRCGRCGQRIAGHFLSGPGQWGRKRVAVDMRRYAQPDAAGAVSSDANPQAGQGASPAGCQAPATYSISTPATKGETSMATYSAPTASPPGDIPRPNLTPVQETAALRAASEIVAAAVQRRAPQFPDPTLAGAASMPVFGCFVSIKRKGQLRGCCGFLGRRDELLNALVESATTSATGDLRMPSVVADELPHLELEVWLLHGHQGVTQRGEARLDAVEIGRHGLQIQRGSARGLLLPGVATDHGFDARKFLQQVCVKAGLPSTAWCDDDTLLATFEGHAIKGKFDTDVLSDAPQTSGMLTGDEIDRLAEFCRDNILAVARGAVPSYYLAGCTDGPVHGIHLKIQLADDPHPLQLSRLVLRNPMPLQSSLYQMSETLGHQLQVRGQARIAPNLLDVELGVLYAPAQHGTVAEPDLAGVDPKRRAILVNQGSKSAWRYDPQLTTDQLLSVVRQQADVTVPESAAIYSFVTQSNRVRLNVVNVPQAQRGPNVRPPAVAGMFYPAEPAKLNAMLDQLTPSGAAERGKWRGAMVPHAGLVYSGRIAADVLRRIEIPETVIVIGPKHTPLGVDWAVAPHTTWSLPGLQVASDPDFAAKLAAGIRGLKLDDAAHRREHAIEVELPWIARFAPHARVIGIALGNANLELCHQFATDLANLLRGQLDQVLLVVSSDMNHYATDAETRRLDAMALEAIAGLDPSRLFQTVRDNQISMCGVLPACIVLECLRQLGELTLAERVAYGTSADTSGDTSRVVGYAGMLFR